MHKSALSARRSSSAASGDALPMLEPGASSAGGAAGGAWPLTPKTLSHRGAQQRAACTLPGLRRGGGGAAGAWVSC